MEKKDLEELYFLEKEIKQQKRELTKLKERHRRSSQVLNEGTDINGL